MKRYRARRTGETMPMLGEPDKVIHLTELVPDPWYRRYWRRLKRALGLAKRPSRRSER